MIGKFYYDLKLNKYTLLGIVAGSIGLVILIYPSFEDVLFGGQTNSSTNTNNKNNFLGISILLMLRLVGLLVHYILTEQIYQITY